MGEAGVVGIVGRYKGFFAVEQRRVGGVAVVAGLNGARGPIDNGAAAEQGVGFGVELGVVEVGEFRLVEVKLD